MHTHHESRKTTEREPVRGLKSLNSHSIEDSDEVVRIYHANLHADRQYLMGFVEQ